MLIYPGFNKVAFSIGPIRVHWYGIMYLLGFAAAWWLARRRAARSGSTWKPGDVDDLIFFAMLGVILGGRIGYVLFYGLQFWADDAWYPFKIWEGGMSFHGGLLGAIQSAARHSGRFLQILESGGQSPDHPLHPAIPETRYLKAFFCRVTRAVG